MNGDKNIIIKIKTTGIDLTPAIDAYAREKINHLEKFLPYYAERSGELIFEIEIGKTSTHHRKGDVFRAEINFSGDGSRMRGEAVKDDIYAALDEAKDEVARELQKTKSKRLDLLKRGGAAVKKFFKREE